jgi:hypothetical protein
MHTSDKLGHVCDSQLDSSFKQRTHVHRSISLVLRLPGYQPPRLVESESCEQKTFCLEMTIR